MTVTQRGGYAFLRALFPKSTTPPPTRNSEHSLSPFKCTHTSGGKYYSLVGFGPENRREHEHVLNTGKKSLCSLTVTSVATQGHHAPSCGDYLIFRILLFIILF